jgi:hypothetical protein
MTDLPDRPTDSTLVLRRLQESLWISNQPGPSGKPYYIVLDSQGRIDYPIVSGYRVLYDYPERLTTPFKKTVLLTMTRRIQ